MLLCINGDTLILSAYAVLYGLLALFIVFRNQLDAYLNECIRHQESEASDSESDDPDCTTSDSLPPTPTSSPRRSPRHSPRRSPRHSPRHSPRIARRKTCVHCSSTLMDEA